MTRSLLTTKENSVGVLLATGGHLLKVMENVILTAWQRVLNDPRLRSLPYKVETNERGQIILSPHKPKHSLQQGRIVRLLLGYEQEAGEPAVGFAIEAVKGVKVPGVVWISRGRLEGLPEDAEASPFAPEICIEVLSSGNTDAEIEEKRRLYFEQGAHEVWVCDEAGQMSFYVTGQHAPVERSSLMPAFPHDINEAEG